MIKGIYDSVMKDILYGIAFFGIVTTIIFIFIVFPIVYGISKLNLNKIEELTPICQEFCIDKKNIYEIRTNRLGYLCVCKNGTSSQM